jgi:hypothetical protein
VGISEGIAVEGAAVGVTTGAEVGSTDGLGKFQEVFKQRNLYQH